MALTGVQRLMPALGRRGLQPFQADVAGGEVGSGGVTLLALQCAAWPVTS